MRLMCSLTEPCLAIHCLQKPQLDVSFGAHCTRVGRETGGCRSSGTLTSCLSRAISAVGATSPVVGGVSGVAAGAGSSGGTIATSGDVGLVVGCAAVGAGNGSAGAWSGTVGWAACCCSERHAYVSMCCRRARKHFVTVPALRHPINTMLMRLVPAGLLRIDDDFELVFAGPVLSECFSGGKVQSTLRARQS